MNGGRVTSWVGPLPVGWSWGKLGAVCKVKARLGWKGLKADEYVASGHRFLSTPNIKLPAIDFDEVNYITKERYDESPEIQLRVGDVLIAKDGSTLGIVNVVRQLPGPSTVNGSIAVIRPRDGIDGVYLRYFLQGHATQSAIQQFKDGMGVPHLFQSDLRKFDVAVPPIHVQRAIADYLDRKTASVDALIEQKERLLRLLDEKRQAVITQVVTKGLDRNAACARSQHEWLGEHPRHWLVRRLKHCNAAGTTISYGIVQPGPHAIDGVPFVQTTNISSGTFAREDLQRTSPDIAAAYPRSRLRAGDVMLGIRASVGAAHVVPLELDGANLSRGIARIVPMPELRADYLVQYLRSAIAASYWTLARQGSTFAEVSIETVKNLPVLVPPLHEQRSIVEWLGREEAVILNGVRDLQRQVACLSEYRQAVITAAVTGKLDVNRASQEAA